MYVKTTSRKAKDGAEVRYLHLAHNQWDPARHRSVPQVLYSFGREDALDRDAIRRLVASLSRLLDPAEVLAATAGPGLVFLESRPLGGVHVLGALWQRLGIDAIIRGAGQGSRGRPRDNSANERVLFGLVASRALKPSSKLAAADWVNNDVHIPGLPGTSDDACYRAMDWLHEIRGEIEKEIYYQVADLLNLEVDLLFFDTTSTYFELEEADEPIARDWRGEAVRAGADADEEKTAGFRTGGKSKDSRDDLPQIIIGMAVTRGGIPVRIWCWPGNTGDSKLIRQVKADMRDWSLGRVVWVADRGFSSKENRRYLQAGAGHYIIAEKLRSDSPDIKAALSRQGRYNLLRSSDPDLSAEDIALGYKQLLEVERGWRDMKTVLDLRPVYHRLEQRIRAHVILCWLALLLIRIVETTTGGTWPDIRRHLDRLQAGTFTGPAGTFRQRTELTKAQADLLAKLAIPAPRQIIDLQPAPPGPPSPAAERPQA